MIEKLTVTQKLRTSNSQNIEKKWEENVIEEQPGRQLSGWSSSLIKTLVLLMAIYQIYFSTYGILPTMSFRSGHLIFASVLVFLVRPFSKKRLSLNKFEFFDIILVILSMIVGLYIIVEYKNMVWRLGDPTSFDVFFGAIAVLLILEGARRTIGPILPSICVVFFLYALFGNYIPGTFGHVGFGLSRIISQLYCTLEGIYGVATGVMSSFVYLFILYGGFLIKSGAGNFFIKLAYSLTGHLAGGPAKTAVFSSALMASINGSAQANVVTTGSFTIPMMKRVGYQDYEAGAIEAASSTAGIFTPPVMGAAAFILAEWVGIPYIQVVLAGLLPAALYYITVWFTVDFKAKKAGIVGLPRKDLPRVSEVLKEGWHFLISISLLVYMLLRGYSPQYSCIISLFSLIVITQISKKNRMSFRDIISAVEFGGRNTVLASMACACAGIVVGIVGLTGIGLKFSSGLIFLSGGNLFWALQLCSLAALFLGMGVSITPNYITLAILGSSSIIALGAPPLAVHLAIFWYANLAELTPPVCISAYTAAAIAKSDPFKTGVQASIIGRGMYIIPPLFIFTPLITGNWGERFFYFGQIGLGLIALTAAFEKYLFKKTNFIETILLYIAAACLIWPSLKFSLIGAVLLIIVLILHILHIKRPSLKESGATAN